MAYRAEHVAYAVAAQSMSKTKQVVTLYDGVISMVQRSADAIRNKDFETRYNLIDKARKVINGLQTALDFDQAPGVAKLLYDYYESIDLRLVNIQSTNRLDVLAQVEKELKIMREAWKKIDSGEANPEKSMESEGVYQAAHDAEKVAQMVKPTEVAADSISISV